MRRNWKQLGIAALLTISFLNLSCAQAQNQADSKTEADINRPVRDKWALIVGIGTFKDKSIPTLRYSSKDALDFYNYLIKEGNFKPDHVRVLLDEQATRDRIISELGGNKFLAPLAKKDDLIVVYFSSHGSPAQLDVRGNNILIAHDTRPDDPWATGIDMQNILDMLHKRVLADRVLLVLDACHSGSINPNDKDGKGLYRESNMDASAMPIGKGKMVLCSSGPDERSWESKRYQNGVFTRNLLNGLKAKGPDTPMSQAFDLMSTTISNEVQEDRPGAKQTPVLNSKWEGNSMILAVKPSMPQTVSSTVSDLWEPDSIAVMKGGKNGVGGRNSSSAYATSVSSDQKTTLASPENLVLTWKYFSNVENPQKAYQAACEAAGANFNNVDMLYNKAKINIQMQKWSAAEQQLKNAQVDDPNRWEFYLARGYCFHKLKQPGMAAREIENAKFKNPTLPRDITFGD